jgi:hypothetical protein
MACRTGCLTQDCGSYAQCLKNANIRIGDLTGKAPKVRRELDAYAAARKQGIQPAGTTLAQTRAAVDASNKVGLAYDATTESFKAA